jgi:Methylamine utilisation protein MauE
MQLIARLLLAGVIAGAAVAKLASPDSSRAALATFGLRSLSVQRLAWGSLIAAELGIAAAVAAGIEGAAYAASALMLMLALVLIGAILQGRAGAPCACFGSRGKIGWGAVARNLALAAGFAALPALPGGELSTDAWLGVGLGVALAACAALGVALLALTREVGMLRLQLGPQSALEIPDEGPPIGEPVAPAGRLNFEPGAQLGLGVFVSESCGVCKSLEPSLKALARDPIVAMRVFEEGRDAAAWRELDVPGAPYAVATSPEGIVLAKGAFNNLIQLESVLGTAERRRGELAAVPGA